MLSKALMEQVQSQYGKIALTQWLRHHYSKPRNITEFEYLFPNHVVERVPAFHREILTDYVGGGRIAIGAPRGFAKSTVTDVIATSWFAIYGKYHFIVIISDTYTQAKMQLGALKAELESNDILQDIYGTLKGSVWGEDTIIVNGLGGEVMIKAMGAGMKIRGLKFKQYRPELAIIDDLENQEAVASSERRHKLERWFNYDLLPGLAKDGHVIYIGTILHYSALLKKVLGREGNYASFKTRLYKAIMDGKSLWPEAYSLEKLTAMRDNPLDDNYVGQLVFAQEYQNEPQDDKDRLFKLDWLATRYKLQEMEHQHARQNPADTEAWHQVFFSKIVTGVDPAISEKTTADYFAMITVGIAKDNGHVYILDYFRDRIGDPLAQVNVVLDNFEKWRPYSMKVEVVAYQRGLYNLIRSEGAKRGLYPNLTPFKPDTDKVRRATMSSALFSGNLVHLRDDHPLYQPFVEELLQFPLGEHDDMLDAFMNATEDLVSKPRPRVFTQKPALFR